MENVADDQTEGCLSTATYPLSSACTLYTDSASPKCGGPTNGMIPWQLRIVSLGVQRIASKWVASELRLCDGDELARRERRVVFRLNDL